MVDSFAPVHVACLLHEGAGTDVSGQNTPRHHLVSKQERKESSSGFFGTRGQGLLYHKDSTEQVHSP